LKHHFGDFLDRSKGYWTIVPNRDRWAYRYPDLADAPLDASIVTIQKDDINWSRIHELPKLRELTLHEPTKEQLSSIEGLVNLTSLRITHARPKSLAFLRGLLNLEELVLEYVSGFSDLEPLGDLSNLHALHLENLRRVKSFTGLGACKSLKYLSIDGTFDWNQPVEDLNFLESMTVLEYLRLAKIRIDAESPVLRALVNLHSLKYLEISQNTLQLEDFAFIEANRPDVQGAVRPAYKVNEAVRRPVSKRDIRNSMPKSKFLELKASYIADDGSRFIDEPMTAFLLGKGTRTVTGAPDKIHDKCASHERTYRALVRHYEQTK